MRAIAIVPIIAGKSSVCREKSMRARSLVCLDMVLWFVHLVFYTWQIVVTELIYTRLNSTLFMDRTRRKKTTTTTPPENSIHYAVEVVPLQQWHAIGHTELNCLFQELNYELLCFWCLFCTSIVYVRARLFVWNVLLFRRISTKTNNSMPDIVCIDLITTFRCKQCAFTYIHIVITIESIASHSK